MEALFLFADLPQELNTSVYRIQIPAKYLKKAGHNLSVKHISELDLSEVPEVVLLERIVTPEMVELLRLAGVKHLIVTFDDHYGLIPKDSPDSYHYWKGKKLSGPKGIDEFKQALGMVDQVIVPSQLLVRDFFSSAKGKIAYVPNYYDPEVWEMAQSDSAATLAIASKNKATLAPNSLVIGWGGSRQHGASWRGCKLADGLFHLKKLYGDRVQISVYARAADESLERAKVSFLSYPWVKFEEWPKHIATFDIGLLPLSGEYDRRRSNLKAIEYGLAGIPWVGNLEYSEPYSGCQGGLFTSDNPKAWLAALSKLIEDETLRKSLGCTGKTWAKTYDMSTNLDLYQKVLWPNA